MNLHIICIHSYIQVKVEKSFYDEVISLSQKYKSLEEIISLVHKWKFLQ